MVDYVNKGSYSFNHESSIHTFIIERGGEFRLRVEDCAMTIEMNETMIQAWIDKFQEILKEIKKLNAK